MNFDVPQKKDAENESIEITSEIIKSKVGFYVERALRLKESEIKGNREAGFDESESETEGNRFARHWLADVLNGLEAAANGKGEIIYPGFTPEDYRKLAKEIEQAVQEVGIMPII